MTTSELCAVIERDTAVLLDSVDRRLAHIECALAKSTELLALARGERDRLVAQCAEQAA